ncbi:hypothetical protein RDI58_017975 [Solanum bulbocastanum]|uniref:Uncharacterized protein n=1 Tax=Solanum bulbocastanum TaxID=147425 RepID=A0AAN8TAM3_SOLBU
MAGWNWCTNDSNNVRGRIWVIWNPNEVTLQERKMQFNIFTGW